MAINLFCLIYAVCLLVKLAPTVSVATSGTMISIRGGNMLQQLPMALTKSWPTWTLEEGDLFRVEESPDEGWVPCTSYSKLFLPADLPPPFARPALGVVITNGSPRYIMPSIVLALDTPERRWRNRGINSLPRAAAWVDLFGPFCPRIDSLKLSAFGQSTNDVRFLEDQDGAASWDSIYSIDTQNSLVSLRPEVPSALKVDTVFNKVKEYLKSNVDSELHQGYHFVDLLLDSTTAPTIRLPTKKMRMFLSDLSEPRRLLEYEESLDGEPLGDLSVDMVPVGAGGSSKYLPEVYKDLYEPGNILFEPLY